MVKEKGLEAKVRVFRSGCIGGCEQGPVALRYPDGELMMGVQPDDLPAILDACGD
jgi:(2Fe-2S) ferredoxin